MYILKRAKIRATLNKACAAGKFLTNRYNFSKNVSKVHYKISFKCQIFLVIAVVKSPDGNAFRNGRAQSFRARENSGRFSRHYIKRNREEPRKDGDETSSKKLLTSASKILAKYSLKFGP